MENVSEHTGRFATQRAIHFDIFVSIELGLGGGRLDKLAIFRHFSPKNTFILFFSKTEEWKTFLMTWSFSFCSENCKQTLFVQVVQIWGGGMLTRPEKHCLDTFFLAMNMNSDCKNIINNGTESDWCWGCIRRRR